MAPESTVESPDENGIAEQALGEVPPLTRQSQFDPPARPEHPQVEVSCATDAPDAVYVADEHPFELDD